MFFRGIPLVDVLVKTFEDRDLGVNGDSHVILDCVQGPQDQVEDAYCIFQLPGQLLDDYCEAASRYRDRVSSFPANKG